jgi:hypothetical protein
MANLDPVIRHTVAKLAAELYAGRLTYAAFLLALPEIDLTVDDAVTELLDLIEHQPSQGRVFGLGPEKHSSYVADIRRRIAELAT